MGVPLSVWRIDRRIGMSGGLFLDALQRETGRVLDAGTLERLSSLHAEFYLRRAAGVVALPGATELLQTLASMGCPSRSPRAGSASRRRRLWSCSACPRARLVVTRDLVERAKPDPDLFLAAADLLGVEPQHSFVVGDSIWDLLAAERAGSLGVGVLSGGYGRGELPISCAGLTGSTTTLPTC